MDNELSKNFRELKQCEKMTTVVFWGYVLTFGLVVAGGILIQLFTFGIPLLTWLTDGIILKAAAGAAGILGVYKNRSTDLYAPAAPIIAGLDLLAFRNVLNMGLLTAAIALMVFTLLINKRMSWLREQPGYPYFSEIAFEQEKDRIQRDIKDPYQQYLEKTVRNSSGEMEMLSAGGQMSPAREMSTGGAMEDVVLPSPETDSGEEE